MRKVLITLIFVLSVLLITFQNAEAKSIKAGMPFDEAEALMKEAGGRETMLSIVVPASEDKAGLGIYYLPDARHILIDYDKENRKITNLNSIVINADLPKGDPGHWVDLQKDAKVIELNKIKLTVEPNSPVYLPGEDINIEVQFKNVSNEKILLSTDIMDLRIQRELRLYSRWEGITYEIFDGTKYKLPQLLPEDFITLKPGGNYSHKYVLKTVFQKDDFLWYKTVDTTQEGIRELPLGEYNILLEYTNQVCGFANNGTSLYDCDAIKADNRFFTGKLVQNSTRNFTITQVPIPENMICWNDDSCTWVGVIPESMGKCGCYSTGYVAAVQYSIKEGLPGSDLIVECEPPPDPDNACFCRRSTCVMDVEWQYDR
ncbi:MAG: hypothetical protein K8S27_05625 [Candidatus Omnitrophica bacterium]|nr:hypothetical protein [Candidatus Omnitrophota bacterium]